MTGTRAVGNLRVEEKMSSLRINGADGGCQENSRNWNPVYGGALMHLFLPKQTPGQQQTNLEQIDEFLLQQFSDSVQCVLTEVPFRTLESVLVMLMKWKIVQPKSSNCPMFLENFQGEVKAMVKGQMIPIYVRNQNCALLLKKSDDEEGTIVLSTFRCSLPSYVVMSTVSDLSMNFPETIETIQNSDMLSSKAFAKQLHDIAVRAVEITLKKTFKGDNNFTYTREVANPILVSDWIVGLLAPVPTQPTQSLERHQFRKKIRDHVVLELKTGSSRLLPFRRSGMYMAIKVALQLKLCDNLGAKEDSRLVYKIIMLRILADVAKGFHVTNSFDMDLASQILAKLGNRVEKLRKLPDPSSSSPVAAQINLLKSKSLEYVMSTVEWLTRQMNTIWSHVIKKDSHTGAKQPTFSPIQKDVLLHSIPRLDGFVGNLKTLFCFSASGSNNEITDESHVLARYTSASSILYTGRTLSDKNMYLWLHDTEKFIKYQCNAEDHELSEIAQLVTLYAGRATSFYKHNPLGKSQVFLVALKGMEILDRIATQLYPLLLKYKPEVDFKIFDLLLLPFQKDMELLDDMLDYFSERHQKAQFPGILSTCEVEADTFSVCFSQQDAEMQKLRDQILRDIEMEILEKYQEIHAMTRKCDDMKRCIMELGDCKCKWKTVRVNRGGNWYEEQRNTMECYKCKLEKQLELDRQSVFRYETPFSELGATQWGVVFELLIPRQFATFREFLAYFKYEIFGQAFKGERKCNGKFWLEYGKISMYQGGGSPNLFIRLGSSGMPLSCTNHTKAPLDVLHNNPEDYIIDNGMDCKFYYTRKTTRVAVSPKTACTFRLNTTSRGHPYFNLQDTLVYNEHTQNSILAGEIECHYDLSWQEFIAFGSLRAGHRVQLWNLYEAIFSSSLSLEQEPVLALILQTIWQVGPSNESTGERESHLYFSQENKFAEEYLDMMDKLVKTNSANYSNSLIFLVAVVITRRISELNTTLDEKCYTFLKSWRQIMSEWMTKIENVLDQPETAAEYGGISSLRKNLLEIVICSMYSYSVHDKSDIVKVMRDEADIVHWVETLFQWHVLQDQPVETSAFFKILQNFVKALPLRLELEKQIVDHLPLFVDSLKIFISKRWNKTLECTFLSIEAPYITRNKESLILAKYLETDNETGEQISHRVTFDLFQGIFLVNGYCQSTLPVEVKEHKLFKRYFKDGTNLRIQRERDNANVTRTVTPFNGRHYEFYHSPAVVGPQEMDDLLIIKEIQEEGIAGFRKLVLLDPVLLSHCVSDYFTDNFTHWLDITNDRVHFRPMTIDHPCDYILQITKMPASGSTHTNAWHLLNKHTRQFVWSIHSNGFKLVTRALERLEMARYITVTTLTDQENSTIIATLRRYNLRFTLKDSKLESVEYPGYCVATNQTSYGTLVGICQGLLLENEEEMCIIMPHSTIHITGNESDQSNHQSVLMFLETLRQPACFKYDFDNELKRLKPPNNKSAWLYLAALHAVTSSVLPDPFTGLTGTEMAVRILQYPCVWSCSPYDIESMATLTFIKELSPFRMWYGNSLRSKDRLPAKSASKGGVHLQDKGSMETTKWPEGLPTMAAYDGFYLIVEKLIADSENLAVLHYKTTTTTTSSDLELDQCESEGEISERLQIRAYLRWLPMYNPAAAVEFPNYFKDNQIELFNGEMDLPEHNFLLRSSSDSWDISSLQLTSFAVLTKSIRPLMESGNFKPNTLTPFLITCQPLDCPILPAVSLHNCGGFQDVLQLGSGFRYNWLSLYSMAVNCKTLEDFHHFGIILSAAALVGAPMDQVANLHVISVARCIVGTEPFPKAPSYLNSEHTEQECYACPARNDYEVPTIEDILANNARPFTTLKPPVPPEPVQKYYLGVPDAHLDIKHKKYKEDWAKYEKGLIEYDLQKTAYEDQIEASCSAFSSYFKQLYWDCPNEKIQLSSIREQLESHNFKAVPVVSQINEILAFWHFHYELKVFVDEVQGKLNKMWHDMESGKFPEMNVPFLTPHPLRSINTLVSVDKVNSSQLQIEELMDTTTTSRTHPVFRSATEIFENGNFHTRAGDDDFQHQKQVCLEMIKELRHDIMQLSTTNISSKILSLSGMVPRLDPQSILKTLTGGYTPRAQNSNFTVYAGALGVLWTHLKRLNRCIRAPNKTDLKHEIENPGHQNWSPKDHPEWLLLELELDIMIRPIQVKVAKQMITMPNEGNGVTQLNMGKGKTSVIVPMLCATLAQRNNQLCRVTVLNSMYKMNLNSWTFSIGGLLNRRVYSIPCRRDMDIDLKCVNQIMETYQECLKIGGVVLTLPEYRLSFRILAYDKMLKNECILGQRILQVENFLRAYARDVMDESDELFSAKYQLVYTIGEPIPIDGGKLRWITCQKILDTVHKVAGDMIASCGTGQLEFDQNLQEKRPHEFSTFRLLGESKCLDQFIDLVAESVLSEIRLTKREKAIVKKFLVQNEIGRDEHLQVISSIFNDSPDVLNKILLVSGYLKRGVLGLALTKRWRVEYGVNPKPGFPRRMAIPFRGKDVAAENTEFGHPDLAIILTHLSYYYSGLNSKQMQQVFEILKGKHAADIIYSEWISKIKIPGVHVPHYLGEYRFLNMKDSHQKSQLFGMLRKHKMVVNFWLSHCVLPRECKQFPGKLVMTAWDLCYERQRLPVTAFSGTNGSQGLLPPMISQQDLDELKSTNMKMERTLLSPENTYHKGFQMDVTCQDILETMKQDKLTVLIDAGALMLKCSNEQVADLWLEVDPNIEACVYFSHENELVVKRRGDHGTGVPFEVSPYQGRLDKCGVFLDDQHTRGTDLRFPQGSRACVTVAARMTRDKLIQACMRMRKLGKGHTVTFYLSHEARNKVYGRSVVTTQAVLDWVCQNTKESNEDGLLYWALAGRNYAQRLAAEDHFHYPHYEKPYILKLNNDALASKATVLAEQSVDDEVTKLMDMYGHFTQMKLLIQLIPQWFASAKLKLHAKNGGHEMCENVMRRFDKICETVTQRCLEKVPAKKHVSSISGIMMEEEQENELELELEKEIELEEEREVKRPQRATPAIPNLHEKIKSFAINGGELHSDEECFLKLSQIFENVTFWNNVQPECWQGNVFVTKDFATTIVACSASMGTYLKTDLYLRPFQFMISYKLPSGGLQLLALSPYEVNELLPYFQERMTKCTLHMFSMRRTKKQDLLLNNPRLQLPFPDNTSHQVPDDGPEIASLLLASGNLYFISMAEQIAFVKFLGLVPRPWSEAESEADERGWITKSGFLLPEHRLSLGYEPGFDKDPTSLIKKILQCRHPIVSEVTHLLRLLDNQCYVEID